MTLAQLVPILMPLSVALLVFGVGARAAPGDLTYLLRQPALLVRSVLAMNVIMPLVAVGIAAGLHLERGIEVALILLAVSPVPPILPAAQIKAGGNASYAVGLLAFAAALGIVTVPLSVMGIARLFGAAVEVPPALVARVVGITVLAPLLVGTLTRRVAPGVATALVKPFSLVGSLVLGVIALLVLAGSWRGLTGATGGFTVVAVLVFVLLSLVVGHVLGGPDEDDRTVLALSTATRHPGVALALAGAVAADQKPLSAAVMLAFLVALLVTAPYKKWRARAASA